MGRIRMTRKTFARFGVLAGGTASSLGVGMAAGVAVGLIVGGALFAAWCLFLADVDPADRAGKAGRS